MQSPKDAICEDANKAAGTFYVYDYADAPSLSPAPKGYKPFYISHFARHGARYCTSEYDTVHKWLAKASEGNVFTEKGREFFERFEKYYDNVRLRKGNLTAVGKAQHRAIARHMYERFPEVFKGPTNVIAVSTESPRVIMSMWSCLSQLQSLDADLNLSADASAVYSPWLQPILPANPLLVKGAFDCGKQAKAMSSEYFSKTVPWQSIAERLFTSSSAVENVLKITPEQFISSLHAVISCTRCLDCEQDIFDDILSPEERYLIWKCHSAEFFLDNGRFEASQSKAVDYASYMLEQIINSAESDFASGDTQLRLRFGHDSGLAPLLVLLDVNGYGRRTSSLEESLEILPNYNIPMGASLQFIFFKNKRGNILFKVLLNEREATLPLPAVSDTFYNWTDFKNHYSPFLPTSRQ